MVWTPCCFKKDEFTSALTSSDETRNGIKILLLKLIVSYAQATFEVRHGIRRIISVKRRGFFYRRVCRRKTAISWKCNPVVLFKKESLVINAKNSGNRIDFWLRSLRFAIHLALILNSVKIRKMARFWVGIIVTQRFYVRTVLVIFKYQ